MFRHAAIAASAALLLAAGAGGQIRVERGAVSGPRVSTGSVEGEDSESFENLQRRCAYHLEQAARHVADEQYYPAWQSMRTAAALGCPQRFPDLREQWAELAGKLDLACQKLLAEADEDYRKGAYKQALKAYQRLAVAFAGSPVAEDARQRLEGAKLDSELKAALAEERAATMFKSVELMVEQRRRALAKSGSSSSRPGAASRPAESADASDELELIKLLGDEDLARSLDEMERIVKYCPDTPTAAKAAEYLAALQADPALQARIVRLRQSFKAQQALALAEAYFKAGLPEKAAQRYREVVEAFPGTAEAGKAEKQLAAVEAKLHNPYKMGQR